MGEVRRWPNGRTITPEEAEAAGIQWEDLILYTTAVKPSR
jgi:hypothetical protein